MDIPIETMGIDENGILALTQIRKSMRAIMRESVQEELSPNEIEVLLFLAHTNRDTAREIAQVQGASRSLVSRSVDHLLKKGYIEAKQDRQDRRVVHLALLPKAEQTVDRLSRVKDDFFARLCKGITPEEFDVFHTIMRKIEANVKNDLPRPGVKG